MLSGILFVTLGLGADGAPALVQSRTPPPAIMGLMNIPASLAGYSYTIMKLGPLQFTRKGLSVASTAACLTFTVSCFYSYLGPIWFLVTRTSWIPMELVTLSLFYVMHGFVFIVSRNMKEILMVLVNLEALIELHIVAFYIKISTCFILITRFIFVKGLPKCKPLPDNYNP